LANAAAGGEIHHRRGIGGGQGHADQSEVARWPSSTRQ